MDKKNTPQISKWIPPVVTIMGHVDHGKTTLLDKIRSSNVAEGESGGITQHIGSYSVEFQGKQITFIDTPGHEAFSAMRSRGGMVADIVILVVAATEGLMPQTLEAISVIEKTKTPVIVALTKIDLPAANSTMVKGQLAKNGILVEGFGGNVVCIEVSGKTGKNIDQLLEMILLTAEMIGLKGSTENQLEAYVIESLLDRKRGPVATVVVKNGKISLSDEVYSGVVTGKVKQILTSTGDRLDSILPGMAGEILGFSKVPAVSDSVHLGKLPQSPVPLPKETVPQGIFNEERSVVNIIIKADVMGSLEAVKASLTRLPDFGTQAAIIFAGVGDVTDSDINLAKASSAIIVAFRVKIINSAKELAESLEVEIRPYDIIYKVIEDIELALKGIVAWKKKEGRARALVLKTFPLQSGDVVVGCKIVQGTIKVGNQIVITRDGVEVSKSQIKNLKTGKAKVEKVSAEKECGILLYDKVDVRSNDTIEVA